MELGRRAAAAGLRQRLTSKQERHESSAREPPIVPAGALKWAPMLVDNGLSGPFAADGVSPCPFWTPAGLFGDSIMANSRNHPPGGNRHPVNRRPADPGHPHPAADHTDWRAVVRSVSKPAMFLLWIASWVGVPLFGLEVLGFGRTAFDVTGMAVGFGPPIVWLAFRGARDNGKTRPVRSAAPFVLIAVVATVIGGWAIAAGSTGAVPVVCLPLQPFI